jgi:hypothetical protein
MSARNRDQSHALGMEELADGNVTPTEVRVRHTLRLDKVHG